MLEFTGASLRAFQRLPVILFLAMDSLTVHLIKSAAFTDLLISRVAPCPGLISQEVSERP